MSIKEEWRMRNILITVMMLIVVAIMFNTVIADDSTGVKSRIEKQGDNANKTIERLDLSPGQGGG